tara:strand:+ start:714 stop:1058 length:345 start_codon:yes stop_codon:yes gene_type:complete
MIRTIQERNNALIDRLNDMVRESPISGGFGLLGQILVDQGLADTRAGSIDDACNYETDVDYDDLISAINHCDGSNFPWLLKIAPRLVKICLEARVSPALIERTEDALEVLKEAS